MTNPTPSPKPCERCGFWVPTSEEHDCYLYGSETPETVPACCEAAEFDGRYSARCPKHAPASIPSDLEERLTQLADVLVALYTSIGNAALRDAAWGIREASSALRTLREERDPTGQWYAALALVRSTQKERNAAIERAELAEKERETWREVANACADGQHHATIWNLREALGRLRDLASLDYNAAYDLAADVRAEVDDALLSVKEGESRESNEGGGSAG